jgi:hypothetical protein
MPLAFAGVHQDVPNLSQHGGDNDPGEMPKMINTRQATE